MIPENVDVRDIIALARRAGEKTLEYFQHDIEVERKADNSPLTEADMASNKILLDALKEYGYPIYSEETEPKAYNPDGYLWIVDPLDGTSSFIKGTTDYSVMIGLAYKGEPVLGVVYQPAVDTLFYAVKGGGAFVEHEGDTQRLAVSGVRELSDAKLLVSRRAPTIERFSKLIEHVAPQEVVYISSNGVKVSMIAHAQAEIFFNPSKRLGSYDYCAPHVIIKEAGGEITYIDGSTVVYDDTWGKSGIAVSNGALHKDLLSVLQKGSDG